MAEDLHLADLEAKLGALFEDPGFYEIHRRMSPFNLFEAVGATRAELRHSNFLAYLLSPNRPHGLGARPLAALLRSILLRMPVAHRPIMPLLLIAGDLDDAIVYRERDGIDILIELPKMKFVVAIENKVGSKAGDGQLKRYSERLQTEFPLYRRLLVFLTPDSSEPDHEGYVAFGYTEVAATLENLTSDPLEPVPAETKLIIQHYVDMVRRHIVQDESLRSLAVTLYERHKEAFDYIFKCRPEPTSLVTAATDCIRGVQGLALDSNGVSIVRFTPEVWDHNFKVIKGDAAQWSKSGRGLLFEIKTYSNMPGRVHLILMLGPVDDEIRRQVYQQASSAPQVFKGLVKPMGKKWTTLFSRDLLTASQAKNLTFEQQEANVRLAWSDFQGSQLGPLISTVLEIDAKIAEAAGIAK